MLNITKNDKELILIDMPYISWLAGLSLVLMSAISIFFLGSFYFENLQFLTLDNWLIFLAFFICVIVFIWGIYFVLKVPIITTNINSGSKTLTFERKSFLRQEYNQYKFDETTRNLSLETTTDENARYFSPQIILKNGEHLDLMSWGMSNKGKCFDIIDLANSYMDVESAKKDFKLTIINDD